MKTFNLGIFKALLTIGFWALTSFIYADVYNSTVSPILPPTQMSVIGLGMGDAVVGDGTLFNATSYNPALLAEAPSTLEFLQPTIGVSNDVFSVYNYLQGGISFDPGTAFQNLAVGYLNPSPSNNANITSSLQSLDSITNHLTNQALQAELGGNISVKFSPNFGIEIYNSTHALGELRQGPLLQSLTSISLPYTGASSLGSAVTVMQTSIQTSINTVIPASDQSGIQTDITNLKNGTESIETFVNNVGPELESEGVTLSYNDLQNLKDQIINSLSKDLAYLNALAYSDTVAMATIDFNPLEDFPLTVGINVKVIRRYYSWASLTLSTNNTDQLTNLQNDFEQPTTRWGVDLGFLYAMDDNLNLGLSFEDLIKSSATIPNASNSTDILYNVITDPAPTVTRIGLSWHPIQELSLNSDIDDVFSTTSLYSGSDYFMHFKLGAALTLANILQLRGGLDDENLCGGAGIQLGFLNVEYSYAMDDLSDAYNHYAQLGFVF